MNIPDEAIDVVAAGMFQVVMGYQWSKQPALVQDQWRMYASEYLRRAAPHIAEQVLRDAADKLADIDFEPEDANTPADVGVIAAANDLRKWADELGPK